MQLDGEDLELLVTIIPAPSMFPAGTVGWGSLNPFEAGFFQTTHMVFDGNPDAEPPVGLPGDFNADQRSTQRTTFCGARILVRQTSRPSMGTAMA